MSTLIAESLDWVTFSDEDDERCGAVRAPCSQQAAAIAVWETFCRCWPERQPLCVRHRDATLRKAALQQSNGRVWVCYHCLTLLHFAGMEPLR